MLKEKIIKLKEFNTETGSLTAIEGLKDIPFDIKRIFYISTNSPTTVRGNHANKKSQFILICLTGSVNVSIDNGKFTTEYLLNDKNTALYIPNMLWKQMYNFTNNAILLCISDYEYDDSEYIYDYQKYLEEIK